MFVRAAQLLAAVALLPMVAVPGRSQATVYTSAQASDGLAAYQTNCASCHLPDLAGRNEAPQLAGSNFINAWGARSTAELFRYMQSAMPPSNAGGLSDDVYASIVAFLLWANGAPAGNRPLTMTTPVRIDSVANGQIRRTCARFSLALRLWTRSPLRARLRPKVWRSLAS